MRILVQITSRHFVAGVVFTRKHGEYRVTDAAPILRYMMGWVDRKASKYVRSKGWDGKKISTSKTY